MALVPLGPLRLNVTVAVLLGSMVGLVAMCVSLMYQSILYSDRTALMASPLPLVVITGY